MDLDKAFESYLIAKDHSVKPNAMTFANLLSLTAGFGDQGNKWQCIIHASWNSSPNYSRCERMHYLFCKKSSASNIDFAGKSDENASDITSTYDDSGDSTDGCSIPKELLQVIEGMLVIISKLGIVTVIITKRPRH